MKPFFITAIMMLFLNSAWSAKPLRKIAILGDSLSEGYGIEKSESYISLAETELNKLGFNVRLINASVSGSTTASAKNRIEWLLKSKPDVIFIALGGNDGLRGVDLNVTRAQLTDAITLIKKNNITVWFSGMKLPPNYGQDYTKKFESLFKEIAKKEKVPFLPFILEGIGGNPEFFQADGIHPNTKGHKKMAEIFVQFAKAQL